MGKSGGIFYVALIRSLTIPIRSETVIQQPQNRDIVLQLRNFLTEVITDRNFNSGELVDQLSTFYQALPVTTQLRVKIHYENFKVAIVEHYTPR